MVDVLSLSINHFRFIDDHIHQTEILGFLSSETATCQHQFLSGGIADFTHHKRRNRGRCDAQAHLGEGELGFLFRNHDVGGSDDAVGPANAGAMHIHNDRLVAEINGLEKFGKPLGIG